MMNASVKFQVPGFGNSVYTYRAGMINTCHLTRMAYNLVQSKGAR